MNEQEPKVSRPEPSPWPGLTGLQGETEVAEGERGKWKEGEREMERRREGKKEREGKKRRGKEESLKGKERKCVCVHKSMHFFILVGLSSNCLLQIW